MTLNYGAEVFRSLDPQDSGFIHVTHYSRKPPLAADHNLDGYTANKLLRDTTSQFKCSGIMNFTSANPNKKTFIYTQDIEFATNPDKRNLFAVQNFTALVNGHVVPVTSSKINGGTLDDMDYCTIRLGDAPPEASRRDLVFLEVWMTHVRANPSTSGKPSATKLFKYGNTQYRGTNLDDDILQTDIGKVASGRLQLQYAIRIAEQINFDLNPDGLTQQTIKAQGGGSSASLYTFTRVAGDYGLFVAGDGSAEARSAFNCIDGKVFAIPLFAVARRNSSDYVITDIHGGIASNPNGSGISVMDGVVSDRPDGLFYDEITENDMMDLRYSIKETPVEVLRDSTFFSLINNKYKGIWQSDWTEYMRGRELLEVDAIASPDTPGVYNICASDGFRRTFSDVVDTQTFLTPTHVIDYDNDYSSYPITYTHLNRVIVLAIDPLDEITEAPVAIDALTDAVYGNYVTGGWTGIGSSSVNGVVDVSAPTSVRFVVKTQYHPEGLRFVPNVKKVYNARQVNPEDWSFFDLPVDVTTPKDIDYQPKRTILSTYTDVVEDTPPIAFDSNGDLLPTYLNRSHVRIYKYHLQGNGTNTYRIPSEFLDSNVIGIYAVYASTIVDNSFSFVPVTDIEINSDDSFTVKLSAAQIVDKVVRFHVMLGRSCNIFNKNNRGFRECFFNEWLQITSTGGTQFNLKSENRVYASLTTKAFNTLETDPEQYIFYQERTTGEITAEPCSTITPPSINPDIPYQLRLTTEGTVPADDIVKLPVLSYYQLKPTDKLAIFYTHQVFGGIGDATLVNNGEILSIGDFFIHTKGTGDKTALDPAYIAMSLNFPLASNLNDSMFIGDQIEIDGLLQDFQLITRRDYFSDEFSNLFAGSIMELKDINILPQRGIARKNLMDKLSTTDILDKFYAVVSPLIENNLNCEILLPILVKSPNGEALLVVLSWARSFNNESVVLSTDVSALHGIESIFSFDVYRLINRQLLK